MKIALGSDHAGFAQKEMLRTWLSGQGYEIQDFGTHSPDSMDYPDVAHPLSEAVAAGEYPQGILLCGSANGVAITANKHAGVRAAIAWLPELASLARQHNNANVLCVPARYVSDEQAQEIVSAFLKTDFEGGRHQQRVSKINN
ncbi:ribose 5-phosphate isomerase B [Hymenobacter sp. BT770]|uniref:ribose 5-phosphate isomerase B n=1 Tax=Hymenobacter sp. BT770 TaxID=2886942 RepID=UPI001D11F550|nr:ribose 5-phosphate isomerase B [Hymenobacter sp. BT770]MCC3154046.1 ribose 5-phosphate isomerase B [Hymenobacter sp. BT770]MDO3416190.1 ribose 5-phosphate isomerase B [Hymenobacter sp. BT770]